VAVTLALPRHLAGALLHAVRDPDRGVLLLSVLEATAGAGLGEAEGAATGHRPAPFTTTLKSQLKPSTQRLAQITL